MKINNTTNPEALKAYGSPAAQPSQTISESGKSQPGSTVSIQDKVDISSKVRMFQDIKKAALDAPDIRTEKVAEIGQKIHSGTYRPDFTLVADKLLSSDISLKI
jgi:negative regulator of flagellin synthesis FlgM